MDHVCPGLPNPRRWSSIPHAMIPSMYKPATAYFACLSQRHAVMRATTDKNASHERAGVRSSSDCVGMTKLKTIINASKASEEMAIGLWKGEVVSGTSLFRRDRSCN